MIICATQTTASKKLQEVSREFLASPDMCKLVSDIRDNSGLALEVHYIKGQKVRIEAYGKGAAVRGLSWGAKRPDLVGDIQNEPVNNNSDATQTATTTNTSIYAA